MTLETNKTARQQEPIPELYHFISGDISSHFTSYNIDLTFQGDIYLASPIKRSGLSYNNNFGNVIMSITAPLIPSLNAHIANQPIETVHVTVYQSIVSDLTDWEIFFTGTIKSVTMENKIARAVVEANSEILRSRVPIIIFQSECNWDLADSNCKLDEGVLQVPGTVTTINGIDYTVSGLSAYADGYFTGGVATAANGTDMRLVTNWVQSTGILTLQVPFDSRVAVNDILEVLPGCDGNPDTCKNKFSNFDNYLGMPYIPTTNPVMWGFK